MKIPHLARYLNLTQLNEILTKTKTSYVNFLPPVLCSLIGGLLEAMAMSLLVPVLDGLVRHDFHLPSSLTVLKYLGPMLPSLSFSDKAIFVRFAALIFIAGISSQVFFYVGSVFLAKVRTSVGSDVRVAIMQRYLGFGKAYFDESSIGQLHGVFSNHAYHISEALNQVQQLLNGLICAVAYLAIMMQLSMKLTFFSFAAVPLLAMSTGWLRNRIQRISMSETDLMQKMNKLSGQLLGSIPLIKMYTNEERELHNFRAVCNKAALSSYSLERRRLLVMPLQESVWLMFVMVMLSLISFMVVHENANLGGFLVYFLLIRRLSSNIATINAVRVYLAGKTGLFNEVLILFHDEGKHYVPDGADPFPGLKTEIRFNNLDFHYSNRRRALNRISFTIEKNSVVAIVGQTGAGKTTLMNLLLRLYDCPPNSILIDGVDIRKYRLDSIRRHVAVVSQTAYFINDTLRANVIYGIDRPVSDDEIFEVMKQSRLYDFVISLPQQLDTIVGDNGLKLSGGEQQRLSIARALVKHADILILDEATSSLDIKTETLVQEAVDTALQGKTAIVIAHRLSTITRASKIVVVEAGSVVEQGSFSELLERKGTFYKYWRENIQQLENRNAA